jgi:acetamidase/formamidase
MKLPVTLLLLSMLSMASWCPAATYELKPTPSTVVWGYYSASAKPAIKVQSGDTVRIESASNRDPVVLEAAGVPASDIPPALGQIYREVRDKGPGIHILTGPVYVEGSEPGDVLEVRILKIDLAVPFAYNAFRPGSGFLPNDFPYARLKIISLDRERMVAKFSDKIEIPCRPFFGSMGVAPPDANGRISSMPPWISRREPG